MNSLNLICKNLKHNKSDYYIYTFSISILYMLLYALYNITQSQRFMVVAENVKAFRSLVLPFTICIFIISINFIRQLIVFLVDKRKKPFSIYTLNGMNSWRFAAFFTVETSIAGIISILSGCGMGIVFTQGLAWLLKKIFEVENLFFDIVDFVAIVKICIFFIFVQLANLIYVRHKFKKDNIFKMLQSSQEGDAIKETGLKRAFFQVSLLLLVIASAAYFFEHFVASNDATTPIYLFICFIVLVIALYKEVYIIFKYYLLKYKYKGFDEGYLKHAYKKLCRTELKYNWKKNAKIIALSCTLAVITSICLILSLTLGGFFKQNIAKEAPFDLIVSMDYPTVDYNGVISFIKEKTRINSIVNYKIYQYESEENKDFPQQAIKLSDYNKLRKILNLKEAVLNKNEYAVHSEDKADFVFYSKALGKKDFKVGDFKIKGSDSTKFYREPFSQKGINGYLALLVLEDNIINDSSMFKPIRTILTADIDDNVDPDLKNQLRYYINKSDNIITDVPEDARITLNIIMKRWTRLNGLVGLSLLSLIGLYIGILIMVVSLSSIAIYMTNNIDKVKYDYKVMLKLGIKKKILTSEIRYKLKFFIWPGLLCGLSASVMILGYLYFKLNNLLDNQFFLLVILGFVLTFEVIFYQIYYKMSYYIIKKTI